MEQLTKRLEELEAERNNKTDYKVCNAIMSYDEEEVSAIDYQRGNPMRIIMDGTPASTMDGKIPILEAQ